MSVLRADLKVAILQTGETIESALDEHGDYDEMCKSMLGLKPEQADTFRVLDGFFPTEVDKHDVYVITGSRHGVYEPHAWIPPLEQLIRDIYQAGKKLVGVCFGHQIMAQALGGVAEKSDKGLGVGLMGYHLKTNDENSEPVSLYAWHQDQVTKAPEGTEVIATSDFCPIAGLRYGRQAISFQAHPEFSASYERALLLKRRGITVDADTADAGLKSLEKPSDSARVRSLLIEFANTE